MLHPPAVFYGIRYLNPLCMSALNPTHSFPLLAFNRSNFMYAVLIEFYKGLKTHDGVSA